MELWFQSYTDLRNHPKTIRLARELRVPKVTAIGHLHLLWGWCMHYAPDGDLSAYDHLDIAIAAEWEGDSDAFVGAMESAGFLDMSTFTCRVHNWDRYGGRLLERKERNAERMRQARATQQEEQETERAAHVQRTDNARAALEKKRVEESRREESREDENTLSPTKSAVRVSYPDEFEQFWSLYPSGHGSKKKTFEHWKKLTADEREQLMALMPSWIASDRWQRGFVKDAAVWIRDGLWSNPPSQNGAVSNWRRKQDQLLAIANGEQVL
jgi:hypothetical protein